MLANSGRNCGGIINSSNGTIITGKTCWTSDKTDNNNGISTTSSVTSRLNCCTSVVRTYVKFISGMIRSKNGVYASTLWTKPRPTRFTELEILEAMP